MGDSRSSNHLKRERKSAAKNDSSSQSSGGESRRRPSSTSDSERKSTNFRDNQLACADPSKSKSAPRDTNSKKQFTCHKCSAEFSSNSVLMSHMERHRRSPWKKDPWKCGACREKFTDMKQLAKHVKQYHGVKKWEKASKLVKF